MRISDWSSDVCSSDLLSAAFVDQIGDGNTASISQSVGNNPNPTGGTDPVVATAEITQSGNGNYSTVNQFGGSATQSARLMVAESVQSGNNNLSTISQTNNLVDDDSSANGAFASQRDRKSTRLNSSH